MSNGLTVLEPLPAGATEQNAGKALSGWSDWVGMVASIGCAIHCAAMPFVIAYLPALGLSFLADEAFHKWMAVGCFAIALTAFVPGLRKHGRLTPVIVGSVGLVMISIAAFGLAGECCAACESNSAQVGLVNVGDSGVAGSALASEGCTDTCCDLCASSTTANDSGGTSIPQATVSMLPTDTSLLGQWISRVAPWLTPIGGIILVAAHLLNRRFGCLCGCCTNESAMSVT
ncbi:MAG: MerC domain-containing protein [Rubripirellula sp.]